MYICHKLWDILYIYLRGTLQINASFKVLCKSLVAHWL